MRQTIRGKTLQQRTTNRPPAFTLIEVLVTMAILSLLIAILLPSLAGAQESARAATCLAQQKQIGTAIFNYAAANNDSIPYGPRVLFSSLDVEPDDYEVFDSSDFYRIDGMVSSQISAKRGGRPVGIGLLLEDYLNKTPKVLFCPGADQETDAEAELAEVGVPGREAVSSYFYRHGSNIPDTFFDPREEWDDHTRLSDMGFNRNGEPIKTLLMDQNFITGSPAPSFGVVVRTNHATETVNFLFTDGRAEKKVNDQGQYNVDVGFNVVNLLKGPEFALNVFELVDEE